MTEVFRELLASSARRPRRLRSRRSPRRQDKLEESVCLAASPPAGPELVLINDQKFTKTANCWGVDNMAKGTNTNRIVLFRRPKC